MLERIFDVTGWKSQRQVCAELAIDRKTLIKRLNGTVAKGDPILTRIAQIARCRLPYLQRAELPMRDDPALVALVQSLPSDDQRVVSILANILAHPDRPSYADWIDPMIGHIKGVKMTMKLRRRVRTAHADPSSQAPQNVDAQRSDERDKP